MTGTSSTSHHTQAERTRCWTESGAHFFAKESDGVWVCRVCGDVRQMRKPAAAVAGRDITGSTQ